MKKAVLLLSVFMWEIICFSSIVVNFKKYRIPDFIVILIMMMLPIVVSVAVKTHRKHQKNLIDARANAKIERLKDGMPIIENTSLFLGNETLHFLEPAILLVTKNKVVGRTGSGGGISIRLAKGISVRTGSYGGTPIYRDVTTEFRGQLAVTNNRILFIHPQKGFEIRLKDIPLIDLYSNGVVIQTKNKSYSLLIDEPRYFLELIKKILENNKSEALA